ncbi:CASP-like protein 13 [Zea mays]|jgi:pilus assembly protein CpaE
MKDD